MEQWHDFWVVAGTAAATLLGLLFVALSVNKDPIAARPLLRSLARQTFLSLGIILLLAVTSLVPSRALSPHAVGGYFIFGAVATLVLSGTVHLRTLRENRRRRQEGARARAFHEGEYLARVAVYNLGLLCILAAGRALWRGDVDGARFLLPAVVLLGALALGNSWGLVLRVEE